SLIALNYFLLALFFGEQSILLFISDIPIEIHVRLTNSLIYILPPLMILFIHKLFPAILNRAYLLGISGVSVLFLAGLIFPVYYSSRYNIIYFFAGGLGAMGISLLATVKAIKAKLPGALLLFFGVLSLLILASYAIFLFYSDK